MALALVFLTRAADLQATNEDCPLGTSSPIGFNREFIEELTQALSNEVLPGSVGTLRVQYAGVYGEETRQRITSGEYPWRTIGAITDSTGQNRC